MMLRATRPLEWSRQANANLLQHPAAGALPVVDYDRLLHHAKVVGDDRLRGVDVENTRHGVHKDGKKGPKGTRKKKQRKRENTPTTETRRKERLLR